MSKSYYVYDLPKDLLSSLVPFSFSGDLRLPDRSNQEDQTNVIEQGIVCSYCGKIDAQSPAEIRQHYRKDFHRLNIKRRLQNLPLVSEEEFEKLLDNEDNLSISSLSGSDESSSDESSDKSHLSSLMKKTELSVVQEEEEDDDYHTTNAHLKGSPYALFSSEELPAEKCLAVYKPLLDPWLIEEEPVRALSLLNGNKHSIVLMIGGGHFAGAVISHTRTKHSSTPANPFGTVDIIAHKSFHRYTTRRKQGGSQSASDNARGKANSAGSSLRRYNEQALEAEIRELLESWKSYIDTCEGIYIRASGRSNRGVVMNYTKAPILSSDKRIRGLPFTTGRATASEVKRSWMELTTAKVLDKPVETQIRKEVKQTSTTQKAAPSALAPKLSANELHTNELVGFIKKSRSPRLTAYLKTHKLSANFELEPSSQYPNTPNLLHFAASQGAHHIVTTLLNLEADPTVRNGVGRTSYELCPDRTTSDAFQLWRASMEQKWDWELAKVGPPLTKKDIDERDAKEKLEVAEKRKDDLARMEKEEAKKKLNGIISRHGAGKKLAANVVTTVGPEASLRGLSDEARIKLERERRARAAEARFAR
jgi:hypothetical protein